MPDQATNRVFRWRQTEEDERLHKELARSLNTNRTEALRVMVKRMLVLMKQSGYDVRVLLEEEESTQTLDRVSRS